MLKHKKLVGLFSLLIAVISWRLGAKLSDNALTIVGVMFSVFFGFYISSLSILLGSSASRFLHEMPSKESLSVSLMDLFVKDFSSSAYSCLGILTLIFMYLVFDEFLDGWPRSAEIIQAAIVGLVCYSVLKLKQLFDVMVKLMRDEAKFAPRSTVNDIENAIAKRVPPTDEF